MFKRKENGKVYLNDIYNIISNKEDDLETIYKKLKKLENVDDEAKEFLEEILEIINNDIIIENENLNNEIILNYLKFESGEGDLFKFNLKFNEVYSLSKRKIKDNIKLFFNIEINHISYQNMIFTGVPLHKNILKKIAINLLKIYNCYYFNYKYYICENGIYKVFDDFTKIIELIYYDLSFVDFNAYEKEFKKELAIRPSDINYNIFIEEITGKIFNADTLKPKNKFKNKPVIILHNTIPIEENIKPNKLFEIFEVLYPEQFNKIIKYFKQLFLKRVFKEFFGIVGPSHTLKTSLFLDLPFEMGLLGKRFPSDERFIKSIVAFRFCDDKTGDELAKAIFKMRSKISEFFETEMKYKTNETFSSKLTPTYVYTTNRLPNLSNKQQSSNIIDPTNDEGFRVRNVIIESKKNDDVDTFKYLNLLEESSIDEKWELILYILSQKVDYELSLKQKEKDNKQYEKISQLDQQAFEETFMLLPQDVSIKKFRKEMNYDSITYNLMKHEMKMKMGREITLKEIKLLLKKTYTINMKNHVPSGVINLQYRMNKKCLNFKDGEYIYDVGRSFKYLIRVEDFYLFEEKFIE